MLDYAEIQPIDDEAVLTELVGHLEDVHITEIRRRWEKLEVTYGSDQGSPMGFRPAEPVDDDLTSDGCLRHLFPWIATDDPWRRLLEAIGEAPEGAALTVHLRGWKQAPAACRAAAIEALAAAERFVTNVPKQSETLLQRQATALRDEALQRVSLLEGSVLAGRVFATLRQRPTAALLATIEAALDDASVRTEPAGREPLFWAAQACSRQTPWQFLRPRGSHTRYSVRTARGQRDRADSNARRGRVAGAAA